MRLRRLVLSSDSLFHWPFLGPFLRSLLLPVLLALPPLALSPGTPRLALASAHAAEPALVQFTAADTDAAGWRPYATKEGITLQRRSVPGSGYYEHRAVVELPLAPAAAAEDVWRALRGGDMATLKHRDVLAESPTELILYDQIRTPVVSDRDYVIRVTRTYDAARGSTAFRCISVADVGPPAAPGHVRIPIIRAGWLVEPTASAGTRLTYYAYSEPGGLITALLARSAQADRSMADILHMAHRLRRLAQ